VDRAHPTHRQSFRVRSYDADVLGRLQAPVLCGFLQEAAAAHARILGVAVETLFEHGVAWVLSSLQLTMEGWPRADEEIVVETWPQAMNRLLVERRFTIVGTDGRPFGGAVTLWLVLDLERRRPIRFPSEMADRMRQVEIGGVPVRPGELAVPEPVERELAFTIRRGDLDLVGHVNNTSYVGWAVEAVPDEVWETHDLAELEIRYLSECRHGQTVVSRSQSLAVGGACEARHQLSRKDDGDEVARARTLWRK
jgi:acyl-ACP thioesterase